MGQPQGSDSDSRLWRGVNHMIISVFHGTLLLTARRRFHHLELVPKTGGVIVASNHVSHLDAFALSAAVRKAGRNPLGMGKIELFRIPVIGTWFARIGHVAVDRSAESPALALAPATEALKAGKVLCMYPEGTLNATPDKGLIEGRTGVARLALGAGVPVVPVGQWGPQNAFSAAGQLALIRPPRAFGWFRRGRRPRRPVCHLLVGPAITPAEISAAAGSASEPDLRAVTDLVMTRIGALVAELSGEPVTGMLNGGTPARVFKKQVTDAGGADAASA